MTPKSGDVLWVTRAASVQFIEPILFRVIRLHDWPTYDHWIWLDGYQLDSKGDAVERRSIFVQPRGLRPVQLQVQPKPSRRRSAPARTDSPRPIESTPGYGGRLL